MLRKKTAQLTVDTNAYTAGDLIGGKMTFDLSDFRDRDIFIRSAFVYDQSKNDKDYILVLFGADPAATTFTDQAAFDVDDADLTKIIGTISLATLTGFNDNGVSMVQALALPIPLDPKGNMTLYAALVSVADPTFAAATDVSVALVIGDHAGN